jgi:hypothetical protein
VIGDGGHRLSRVAQVAVELGRESIQHVVGGSLRTGGPCGGTRSRSQSARAVASDSIAAGETKNSL